MLKQKSKKRYRTLAHCGLSLCISLILNGYFRTTLTCRHQMGTFRSVSGTDYKNSVKKCAFQMRQTELVPSID
jgi:hypothetical protein